MNNIINFNSKDEFKEFFLNKTAYLFYELGRGSEGIAYLGLDGFVYKYINNGLAFYMMPNPKDIITCNDYDLDTFAFPIELYTIDNRVIGYKTKYIENDLFKNNTSKINYDLLLESYYRSLEDIKIISNDNIYMFDCINNVIFNNKNLVCIDTVQYCKMDNNMYSLNKTIFELSIKEILNTTNDILISDSLEKCIKKIKK